MNNHTKLDRRIKLKLFNFINLHSSVPGHLAVATDEVFTQLST